MNILIALLLGVGLSFSTIGGMFNLAGRFAADDIRRRSQLPLMDAIRPRDDFPKRFKPLGDFELRFELITETIAIVTTKLGPYLLRVGIPALLLGVIGLVLT